MPRPVTADALSPPLSTERHLESHQPFLHDLVGVFHAPLQAWSVEDGEIDGVGARGIYLGDTRVVSDLRCTPVGAELSPLRTEVRSAREIILRCVVTLPGTLVDPLLTLERRRIASASGLREELRLRSDDDRPHRLRLRLGLVTDGASMSAIKDPGLLASTTIDRPQARVQQARSSWDIGADGGQAMLDVSNGGSELAADGAVVTWTIDLEAPARGEAAASWALELTDPSVPFSAAVDPWPPSPRETAESGGGAGGAGAPDPAEATPPKKSADPERRAVDLLLRRSLSDLDALRLVAPSPTGGSECTFAAAGAPWFLTLFGRDSLIAASLVLPQDTSLAEGTLRTLAARQGTVVDIETAQQPGKILHEVRAQGMLMGERHLPPVYYGTIDATPLWIELLHDALAAGMDPAVLSDLQEPLEAASRWLLGYADADGDGFLEYLDESGHGLANQGWKDSGDSIRFADGSLAKGTIALAEVQGYAYAAAHHAADLLERLAPTEGADDSAGADGEDLPSRLRAWADALKEAFHQAYWVSDEQGPFIALALDGSKRPVDGVASNMGHLLGTGILDAEQERIVVDRLLDPSMFSGYGIRTLSTTNGGYGPLRYHSGSVWTHDTGYIVRGMLRAGFTEEAATVSRGLLRAAAGFDQRLPELFGGQPVEQAEPPLPYPASCRPQAWAAATAVPVAQALGAL